MFFKRRKVNETLVIGGRVVRGEIEGDYISLEIRSIGQAGVRVRIYNSTDGTQRDLLVVPSKTTEAVELDDGVSFVLHPTSGRSVSIGVQAPRSWNIFAKEDPYGRR